MHTRSGIGASMPFDGVLELLIHRNLAQDDPNLGLAEGNNDGSTVQYSFLMSFSGLSSQRSVIDRENHIPVMTMTGNNMAMNEWKSLFSTSTSRIDGRKLVVGTSDAAMHVMSMMPMDKDSSLTAIRYCYLPESPALPSNPLFYSAQEVAPKLYATKRDGIDDGYVMSHFKFTTADTIHDIDVSSNAIEYKGLVYKLPARSIDQFAMIPSYKWESKPAETYTYVR